MSTKMTPMSGLRQVSSHIRGLRARILAMFLVVAVIALVAALGAFRFGLKQILVANATDTARSQSQQVAQTLHTQDVATAARSANSRTDIVQILDTRGHVIATNQADLHDAITTPHPGTHRVKVEASGDSDSYAVVVTTSHDRADNPYWVAVGVPLEYGTRTVETAVALLAITALILLLASTWGVNRIVTRSLTPVEHIRADVERIRSSRTHERINVPQTGDEVERLAVTMNAMLTRLEQSDAAQRAFVSDASHELRSPLTTIRILTETDPNPSDTTRQIHHETLRMQHLVDDLLTLAKTDDHGVSLTYLDVDLDDVALSAAQRLRRMTSPSRPLTVITDLEPVRVRADSMRLEQAIRNLADNAMRHASEKIRFLTRVEPVAGTPMAVMHVDNDGTVIPPDDREAIFGRFVRLDEARDRDSGGSGLGLAISRAIVQAHGGTLTTHESPDGWCRFTLTLPLPE